MDSWSAVPEAFRGSSRLPNPGRRCSVRCGAARSTTWSWSPRSASRSTARSRPRPAIPTTSTARKRWPICTGLRALVDAVVIGIGTALADNPQLTVRRVTGPQPARVVIDAAAGCRPERSFWLTTASGEWCWPDPAPSRRCRPTSRWSACPAPTGEIRAGRDPRRRWPRRGFRRMLHRRRRQHHLAVSRRQLPRPAACDGGADHSRLGPPKLQCCRRSSASTRRC